MVRGRRWYVTKFYRGQIVGQLGRLYHREATKLIDELQRIHGDRGWTYEATTRPLWPRRQRRLFGIA